MRPSIGTRVTLYVHLRPPSAFEAVTPFDLNSVVARHSSDGFAVMFEGNYTPDVRRMVDDAAAVVAVPH